MNDANIYEIFKSVQGEGGSVLGSCFGKKQIFVRFSGCNLAKIGKSCPWCDTKDAQKVVESFRFGNKYYRNPVDVKTVDKILSTISDSTVHSISLTGGEPLVYADFIVELIKEVDHRYYLETNATLPKMAEKVSDLIHYASCDIKDTSTCRIGRKILEKEFLTLKIFIDSGVKAFSKVVVTEDTEKEVIENIARRVSEIGVPLVLQPAMNGKKILISWDRLYELADIATEHIDIEMFSFSFQMQKLLSIK